MAMDEKRQALAELIAEVKGDCSLCGKINDDTSLINDLGLDSIQIINLIMGVEDKMNVEIDIDSLDMADLKSFGAFYEFVTR